MASGQQLYDLEPIRPFIDQGYTLLTPNLRLARRIKSQWDAEAASQGLKAWNRLDVHSLDHWLASQWQSLQRSGKLPPGLVLDSLSERLLWQTIIEQDAGLKDFSLLRPSAAAQLAAQARDSLLRWQVGREHFERQLSTAGEDCRHFARWLRQFEQKLAEGDWLTAADREQALLEAPAGSPGPKLLLLDFDDIPPLARACLEHLSCAMEERSTGGADAPREARAYPDKAAELSALAGWVFEAWQENPEQSIGVVLIDLQGDRDSLEYLLRREFDCLGERYASLPVNFSTGITLDRAPVVRDALDMLGAVLGTLDVDTIARLVRSRFRRDQEGQGDLAVQLIGDLYDSGQREFDVGQLRFLANRADRDGRVLGLGSVLRGLSGLRVQRLRRPPSAWLEPITQVLSEWGWPGPGPLDSLEYQQVERWHESLERFAGLDAAAGQLDYAGMMQLLTQVCQDRVSQPQTADSGIQVLGPLEAAGLQFDRLWLCGLQGRRWPPASRPNPFLPVHLQQSLDMPHASPDREWRFTEFLTGQYLRSARHVIASYSQEAEGVPELPSALLADWPEADCSEVLAQVAPAWLVMQTEAEQEWFSDDSAPAVEAAERGALVGGSGLIEDQANCPFRAFARRRLGVEPLGDYRIALDAADRGNLLHNALYALWGELGDSEQLASLSKQGGEALVAGSVQSAVEAVPAALREQVGPASLELEGRRLRGLLLEWLELERQREPFRVIEREAPSAMLLGGLELRLRIDRVDQLEDGAELLIDYKSSSPAISQWLGERPGSPQLPLYALARPDTRGLAFAELKQGSQRFVGLGRGGVAGINEDVEKAVKKHSAAPDWDSLRQEWQQNLERLAEAFIAGDARVDPLPTACRYCGLEPLCRVSLEAQS